MEISTRQSPVVPPLRFMDNLPPTPLQNVNSITPPSQGSSQSITPPPRSSSLRTPSPSNSSQSVTPPPHRSSQGATPSRRTAQCVTPPPRWSSQNAAALPRRSTSFRNRESTTTPSRQESSNINRPTRRNTTSALPPVPARWDICSEHAGHKFTALCTTCVKFMCNKCLVSQVYFHQQCSIAHFNDDVRRACLHLVQSVCGKLNNVNTTLSDFQTRLCKKRDRMLKKRNETISEVKSYYNMLRDRLLTKLNRDEEQLLNDLKMKVDNQDELILEKIQQCSATRSAVREKLHSLDNNVQPLDRNTDSSGRIGNLEYVKNLVQTSDYLKDCDDVQRDIAAVRDAFLVIRFFVNSETEQTMLNSNVACVEVLNSRSENHENNTLESERISEAALLNSTRNDNARNDSDEDNIEADDVERDIRLVLPPLDEHIQEDSSSSLDLPGPQHVINGQCEESRETPPLTLADQISEIINEFDVGLNDADGVSVDAELSNEMLLSNIHMNTDTVSPIESESAISTPTETVNNDQGTRDQALNSSAVEISSGAVSETTEPNRRQSVAVTITSDSSSPDPNIPRDDDPPPPYPGTDSSPAPPGPDELPPPYPGSGPPPPYSDRQIPEAQHSPAGNTRHQGHLPRPFSESEFLTGSREIAPPTQTSTPRLTRPKVSKVFSVNEANDKRLSGIFAVASVRGNSFLIVDRWNKKLKYFNESGLSFGGLIFREEPWDITVMTADLVAVTVPKLQTFYKINVTVNSVITTSTAATPRAYSSISFNKNTQLFVCSQVPQFGEPVVDLVSIDGGLILQTFRTGLNSELRFSYPRYVEVNEDGMVIVCDWNLKCLLLFNLDGTVVGRYRGTVEFPLQEPTGIAYNPEAKEIYVIDTKHTSTLGAIHIVNLSCRCKEIVRWDSEFRVARSITPHGSGFALGNKSGVLSIIAPRQRR